MFQTALSFASSLCVSYSKINVSLVGTAVSCGSFHLKSKKLIRSLIRSLPKNTGTDFVKHFQRVQSSDLLGVHEVFLRITFLSRFSDGTLACPDPFVSISLCINHTCSNLSEISKVSETRIREIRHFEDVSVRLTRECPAFYTTMLFRVCAVNIKSCLLVSLLEHALLLNFFGAKVQNFGSKNFGVLPPKCSR